MRVHPMRGQHGIYIAADHMLIPRTPGCPRRMSTVGRVAYRAQAPVSGAIPAIRGRSCIPDPFNILPVGFMSAAERIHMLTESYRKPLPTPVPGSPAMRAMIELPLPYAMRMWKSPGSKSVDHATPFKLWLTWLLTMHNTTQASFSRLQR